MTCCLFTNASQYQAAGEDTTYKLGNAKSLPGAEGGETGRAWQLPKQWQPRRRKRTHLPGVRLPGHSTAQLLGGRGAAEQRFQWVMTPTLLHTPTPPQCMCLCFQTVTPLVRALFWGKAGAEGCSAAPEWPPALGQRPQGQPQALGAAQEPPTRASFPANPPGPGAEPPRVPCVVIRMALTGGGGKGCLA